MSKVTKRLGYGVIALLIALAAFIVVPLGMTSDNKAEAVNVVKKEESDDSATPDVCDTRFVQVKLEREDWKVDPRYAGLVMPLIKQEKKGKITRTEFHNKVKEIELKLAGTNAQTLAVSAFGANLLDNANDWESLVDETDNCLSDAGEELYFQLEGALNAEGVDIGHGTADSSDANSGIDGDTFGFGGDDQINGDLTAVTITWSNGTTTTYLVRCKNLVLPRKHIPPGTPEVPTDNPPPPEDEPGKNANLEASARDNVPTQVTGRSPTLRPDHRQSDQPDDAPREYTKPTQPAPTKKPPKGSTPTTQPTQTPATGANDGDDGGEIKNPF